MTYILMDINVHVPTGFSPEQVLQLERIKFQNGILNLINQGKLTNEAAIEILKNPKTIKLPEPNLPQTSNNKTAKEELQNKRYTRTNVLHRRIQQYDPTTFKLIKTYDGLMDTIRTNPTFSQVGIKMAATKNTIYQGYRWFYIQPYQEIKEYTIPDTVSMQASSIPRYIALLDKEQKNVINVFISQSRASEELGISRKQTINECIHNGRLLKNMYYVKFFDELSDELKATYDKPLPKNKPSPFSKKINQVDPNTKEIIKTFDNIADVIKVFYMSRSSLKRAIETQTPHQGYIWIQAD
jgi:hypothetical protein